MSDRGLPRSVPEAEGLASSAVLNFLEAVEAKHIELHSLALVRHGKIVAEGSWTPYRPEIPHRLFSLTKSFTSTAAGFAVSEGRLSLDDRVVSFFPEFAALEMDPQMESMTVRHLLTMGSGYLENISGSTVWSRMRTNWIKHFLELPLTYEPGSRFVYNSGSSHMASSIVTKATGQPILDYLRPRLFEPLGMGIPHWDADPSGNNTGGWGLNLKIENIAKFGLFYLNRGQWNGRRLLPEDWIGEASRSQISTAHLDHADSREGYGYQFWMCRHGAYRADGAFGQICLVMPEQDAVLALTAGHNRTQEVLDLVWEQLLPAMQPSALPPNPDGAGRLARKLAGLSLAHAPADSESPRVAQVSGRRYVMKANADQVQAICCDFRGRQCAFRLWDPSGEHRIDCGLGEWTEGWTTMPGAVLHHGQQPPLQRVAGTAVWRDERTLEMTWAFIEMPFVDRAIVRFEGNKLIYSRSVNVNAALQQRPTLLGAML